MMNSYYTERSGYKFMEEYKVYNTLKSCIERHAYELSMIKDPSIIEEYEIEQKTIDVIDKYLKHYNYKSMNDVADKWLEKLDIQLKKLDRIGYECMSEAKSKQRNQNNTK